MLFYHFVSAIFLFVQLKKTATNSVTYVIKHILLIQNQTLNSKPNKIFILCLLKIYNYETKYIKHV